MTADSDPEGPSVNLSITGRRITGRAAVLALVAALALTGCSSDDANDGASPTPDATAETSLEPTAEDVAALAAVTVEGDSGGEPTLTFDTPFSVTMPTTRVIDEGSGDPLADGQLVGVHYVIFNGDGTRVGSTWVEDNDTPQFFQLGDPQISVINMAFEGLNVGARVLVANPVMNQDGTTGTSVFLLEADSAQTLPARAEGEAVTPAEGLPVVTLDENGAPSIEIPEGFEDATELTAQTLIQGTGPAVEAGQTVTAHYTGWLTDGTVFDSSWERDTPASFPLANVIPGWQQGLEGQAVGSQVLLVIPAELGYGEQGTANGSIPGGATLIFVVDILAAS